MKSRSLLSTVLLRLIAVTVVTLLATVALLIWQFDRATGVVIDAGLQDMLDAVPQHLGFDAAGRPVADLPPAIENRLDEDYFIAVTDRDGRAYFSVPPGREHAFHPFEPDRTDKPQYFEHRYTESAHTYLGVTQHLVIEGRDIWLQVVEEVPYWKTLAFYSIELFVQGVAVLVIAHLLISAFLCYHTVRATLVPVQKAAAEARGIGPGTDHMRIATAHLPEEVAPLAEAANGALDRLQTALEAQKRFTADAAHELMTPLAVLRAQAESLDNPACAADLLEEIDQMVEMARQLLELAELDALSGPPTDPVDLGRLAEDVAAKLAGPAIEAGIEPRVVVEDAPVIVPGCAKGLRSALENLVKNALRHARGASVVEIRVQAPGRISVIDDGPGVPERDRARIFDRFYRTGASGEAGRGLGLAIVRQIVETHRGTVAVHDGPGGRGAAFVIDLPSFDAAPQRAP